MFKKYSKLLLHCTRYTYLYICMMYLKCPSPLQGIVEDGFPLKALCGYISEYPRPNCLKTIPFTPAHT